MKNISKKVLALAATTMLSYGAIQGAVAQDGYYVKGEVGAAMPKKIEKQKLKKATIFGIEGGYKMNENFRFGLGVNFANGMKFKDLPVNVKAKINSIILETNGYYDIADFNGFTPYLTAGVGVAKNKLKVTGVRSVGTINGTAIPSGYTGGNAFAGSGSSTTSGSSNASLKKTGFAWNIGFGGMYDISPEFAVDMAYRYRDLGKVKVSDTDSKKLKSHNITVGVVYKF